MKLPQTISLAEPIKNNCLSGRSGISPLFWLFAKEGAFLQIIPFKIYIYWRFTVVNTCNAAGFTLQ